MGVRMDGPMRGLKALGQLNFPLFVPPRALWQIFLLLTP
jgi:hypothetical protein